MPPKVLIGVNLVQLAQPFDRDTRSSVVVVTVPCAKTLLCRLIRLYGNSVVAPGVRPPSCTPSGAVPEKKINGSSFVCVAATLLKPFPIKLLSCEAEGGLAIGL